ncbi:MAG: DUF115 domain-containing protein [Spirochaetaceae bacterium]|nr:DUF115 domain-containing protein [Spirochaetaceae bacterium]
MADIEWSPESGGSCTALLESEIGDAAAESIKLIEWRPAISLNPQLFAALLTEIAEFIRRSNANFNTVRHFSERWRRNCERNIRFFAATARKTAGKLELLDKTIVICASGPSLEQKTAELQSLRKAGALLLAVSSSFLALSSRGFFPDFVFASDGGAWARFHFFALLRDSSKKPLVAAPLNAMLPSQLETFPLVLTGDGTEFQTKMLKEAGLPPFTLTQRGTVTASALDFAKNLSRVPPLVFGADFACQGILSHARPYALDALFENSASRLKPVEHCRWERVRALLAGGSLKVFADWWRRQVK